MENIIKILIVEDSITQAEELRYFLESNNYAVQHAINAEKAMEMLEQKVPDIIVSDIIMPGMDGYEFCTRVKADLRFKKIPFILLTSLSDPNDIVKGLECGTDSFISKPFEEEFLLSKIQYLFANFKLRQNQTSELGMEILFGGKKHYITSDRIQLLDLLFSSYEMSVIKNKELQRANDKLKIMHNELEELVETKDKLFNIIAHDLKNNFNPLLGLSEILATETTLYPIEEISNMAKLLHESFNKQYDLLENLLQWVRIQKGQSIRNPAFINLLKIVQETTIVLKQSLLKKNITLEMNMPPNMEVFADENMLNTIFRNLVGNAIKFSFPNGIIKINASQKGNITQVEIIDQGIGIEKELSARLFNKKIFLSRVGTQNETGSGFGLILCRDFIEKHDGSIWIESEPGKGTKISFTLKGDKVE